MNVFGKVAKESLKKNKTRTIVTIIGIILSASMICAVTTFASSFQNYLYESTAYLDGSWEGLKNRADFAAFKEIKSSPKVKEAGYTQILGYARAQDCTNQFKPYIYLLGSEAGAVDMLPVHIISGKFPSSPDEILLPEHLSSSGGLTYKIGDEITLNLGERMLDGEAMWQHNPAYTYERDASGGTKEVLTDEKLDVRESRKYKVTGFYERFSSNLEPYTAPGYTAFTAADEEPSDKYLYDIYYKMKNPRELYDFAAKMGGQRDFNDDVLMYRGVSMFSAFGEVLFSLLAIVIALIMCGSVSLIYNAFSISVSERTKQFGLLSSVGATKKQLKSMVMHEALIVSAVGIPLGVIAGIGGIGVTLIFIGKKFQTILGTPVNLHLSVSYVSVLAAAAIALVTVLISAWVPSKRATKISAIQAVRQNLDVKSSARPIKTSKLMYKIFGLPGMLADKYYKRSRKKYRATVFSLFMSVVLFISAASFSEYLMKSVRGTFESVGYDIDLRITKSSGTEDENSTYDELLKKIQNAKSVTDAAYTRKLSFPCRFGKDCLTDEAAAWPKATSATPDAAKEGFDLDVSVDFVDDAAFLSLLAKYGLSEEKYMDPDAPLAIAVDGIRFFDADREKFTTLNYFKADGGQAEAKILKPLEGYWVYGLIQDENGKMFVRYVKDDGSDYEEGEYLDLPEKEAVTEEEINYGKIIYDRPFFLDQLYSPGFIYPCSLSKAVLRHGEAFGDDCTFRVVSDNHTESNNAIKTIMSERYGVGYVGYSIIDIGGDVEAERNMITILQVFSYGFIVLISLIAAANVFNTISTNISLRRREFAMLKSVGMTAKGFNRMMNFECLLYGSRALIFGLPVSFGVTFLIREAITSGYSMAFMIPWGAVGIAVLSVFAVVSATMMYSMSKVKKENVIDALYRENL